MLINKLRYRVICHLQEQWQPLGLFINWKCKNEVNIYIFGSLDVHVRILITSEEDRFYLFDWKSLPCADDTQSKLNNNKIYTHTHTYIYIYIYHHSLVSDKCHEHSVRWYRYMKVFCTLQAFFFFFWGADMGGFPSQRSCNGKVNGKVLFFLLINWSSYWTNIRVTGDFRRLSTHVMSRSYQNVQYFPSVSEKIQANILTTMNRLSAQKIF